MQPDAITAQLTAIFRDVFGDPALVITPDTKADDIAGWDSGRMIELIVAAESEFGIRFTTREVDGMARVADFVAIIAAKTAHAA
ncbi:acyl carrier protein [Methylobacterium sp. BTF04]|uniref:acyl carrier protein n=1 Tax=Methylobacterium sp. BTF04 TaxID=2708300 RepID=UPI0013D3B651|nr:acyl carrier protein [Methylobacterium sp. BTF04]NEU13240.1 acyl carrier protein [Methylobacterium sp. BTF04]